MGAAYRAAPAGNDTRLFLETMEQVFGGASKVLVDTRGTGNLVYLPLDKLMEQRGQWPRGQVSVEPSQPQEPAPVGITSNDDPRARRTR